MALILQGSYCHEFFDHGATLFFALFAFLSVLSIRTSLDSLYRSWRVPSRNLRELAGVAATWQPAFASSLRSGVER
jgi:hypothetical protein